MTESCLEILCKHVDAAALPVAFDARNNETRPTFEVFATSKTVNNNEHTTVVPPRTVPMPLPPSGPSLSPHPTTSRSAVETNLEEKIRSYGWLSSNAQLAVDIVFRIRKASSVMSDGVDGNCFDEQSLLSDCLRLLREAAHIMANPHRTGLRGNAL